MSDEKPKGVLVSLADEARRGGEALQKLGYAVAQAMTQDETQIHAEDIDRANDALALTPDVTNWNHWDSPTEAKLCLAVSRLTVEKAALLAALATVLHPGAGEADREAARRLVEEMEAGDG